MRRGLSASERSRTFLNFPYQRANHPSTHRLRGNATCESSPHTSYIYLRIIPARKLNKMLSDESPPHARAILRPKTLNLKRRRITPACTGYPLQRRSIPMAVTNHPRMHGLSARALNSRGTVHESPPHARAILYKDLHTLINQRITPACTGYPLLSTR
jgi:hypothetical protein